MAKDAWRRVVCAIIVAVLCQSMFAPKALGLAESTGPDGSNAQAVNASGERGEGVSIGLISSGNVRTTHEAFDDGSGGSRAENVDVGAGISVASHDTSMAGIAAGRGQGSYPDCNGVAPDATMYSARITTFTNLANALDVLTGPSYQCRVVVTGIITTDPCDGQSQYTQLYDYYAYEHDIVFANPAGNYIPAIPDIKTIPVFGDGYNCITTGGLAVTEVDVYNKVGSVSIDGPTYDGRRKPDIVAPSQNQTVPSSSSDTSWSTVGSSGGQTSWSVPHAAGAAALLLGLADDTVEADDDQNEVIKAVIVNSTFPNVDDKTDAWTNPADANNAWNADRGYGRIDALRAYQLLTAGRVYKDTTITADKGWAFDTVADGEEHVYTIKGQKRFRLAATLSWDRRIEWDDAPGPPSGVGKIGLGELTPYLADLDLRINDPSANAIFSETLFGLNPDDNLEKCDILLVKDGDYTIKVVNDSGNGEIADYGFAFELLPPIPADFEPVDYVVDYTDMGALSSQWLETDPNLAVNLVADDVNRVNMTDLAEFMNYWLESDPAYSVPQ